MEQGLRDCCRSIRIGKILVESDAETHVARVVYARFPEDISRRQVLLMYPIMSTGNTVIQAVNVLKEHGVPEGCIILSNLFCTPMAAKTIVSAFPEMKILTSELHPVAPNHFGQKYFGTDWRFFGSSLYEILGYVFIESNSGNWKDLSGNFLFKEHPK